MLGKRMRRAPSIGVIQFHDQKAKMKRLFLALLVLATAVLTGCGNMRKMPFQSEAEQVPPDAKPIYLMTVDVRNAYKPRYLPMVRSVHAVRRDEAGKEEVLTFSMDSKGIYYGEDDDQPPRFFVRLQLEPGAYTLRGMSALGRAFPINGSFYIPLHAPLHAHGTGLAYLGAVSATVRERQGDEFRAGPPIPLIDQAVAGASTGTFDVVVSDRFEEDMAVFRKLFPALTQREVGKAILPPIDRAKAQAWWEGR